MCFAQSRPQDEDPELMLSIDVGYNTAYRDKSWVPVDVTVVNEQEGITGWVEVRIYDAANQLQSPIYRVPADCPKDSRKRFRLHCYVENARRIEAWLYDSKDRPAVEVPAYVIVQSIADEDLMGIIIDDDAIHFGFLYKSLQRGNETVRLHKHQLNARRLDQLPDYAACYDEFDFIIFGEIDPKWVSAPHQKLIRQYVEEGGTLIVCTGLYAKNYRGSWLEDLLGVEFGESKIMSDLDLANAVFDEPAHIAGAKGNRDSMVAMLQPVDEAVSTMGDGVTLAAVRPLGHGRIYTLAVDASSETLQSCAGYRLLWSEMLRSVDRPTPLNLDALTVIGSQQLPNLSGVSIRPLSDVLIYLLLYLGIGVIGNWLFWNRLKRREMAWLCLVFFSVAFCGYAMYFGTAGWTESSELQQISVLRVPRHGGAATHDALVGVLTARTSRYEGALSQRDHLVRDGSIFYTHWWGNNRRRSGGRSVQPFSFVQGDEPAINNFRVGASELRFALVHGHVSIPGIVEGSATLGRDGLSGSFTNKTGLNISEAVLLYEGYMIPLKREDGSWQVNVTQGEMRRLQEQSSNEGRNSINNFLYNVPGTASGLEYVRRSMRRAIFAFDDYSGSFQMDADHGPYFVGWDTTAALDTFIPDRVMTEGLQLTLLVAEVDVKRTDESQGTSFPLSTNVENRRWMRSTVADVAKALVEHNDGLYAIGRHDLQVRLRDSLISDPSSGIMVDLYWRREGRIKEGQPDVEAFLSPPDGYDYDWHEKHLTLDETVQIDNRQIHHRSYSIQDWRDYRDVLNGGTALLFTLQTLYADNIVAEVDADGHPKTMLRRPGFAIPYVEYAVIASGKLDQGSMLTQRKSELPWQ